MAAKTVLDRAKRIKLLAMDVDGVLTAGEIIILDSGEELKIWSVKDRMGFALLKSSQAPIKLAWITARKSRQVEARGEEIGIHFIRQGCMDKWQAVLDIARTLKIKPREIAYIGDDYVDHRAMKNVGLAVSPPESPEPLKKICHYVTKTPAGRGVVREVIEIILQAQGRWKKALSHFLSLFVLWIGLMAGFSACTSSQMPSQDFAEKPDQWVEKFTIRETQGGMPVWILNSEIAQVYDKKKKITLDNFKIEFMNHKGNKKSNSRESLLFAKKHLTAAALLSAPKGEVNTENKDLVAWGGVAVESEDGTTLTTEHLQYSTRNQKITTESAIRIVRKDSILIGEGLEAAPDLSEVKIFHHKASIYPKTLSLRK